MSGGGEADEGLIEEAAEGRPASSPPPPSPHLPARVRRLELLAVQELRRAVPRTKVEGHGADRVARPRKRHALLEAAEGAGKVIHGTRQMRRRAGGKRCFAEGRHASSPPPCRTHLDEGAEGRHARAEARHDDGRERVRGQVHL